MNLKAMVAQKPHSFFYVQFTFSSNKKARDY